MGALGDTFALTPDACDILIMTINDWAAVDLTAGDSVKHSL